MKLPPMNALRAFEAVSRHGSVSKAADELCVSQGAVSQQLRNLEDYFGRELFQRSANSFNLPKRAKNLLRWFNNHWNKLPLQPVKLSGKSRNTH